MPIKKKLTDLETKLFLQQWSRTGLCSYQESNYVFVKSSKLLWAPDFLVKRMKLDLWKICCKLEFHQRWSRVWLDKFHIEMRYATFPIKRDESPGPDECDAAFCGKNRGVVGSNTVHAVQFLFIYLSLLGYFNRIRMPQLTLWRQKLDDLHLWRIIAQLHDSLWFTNLRPRS